MRNVTPLIVLFVLVTIGVPTAFASSSESSPVEAATQEAMQSGQRVEVLDARTETETVFVRPNGSIDHTFHSHPVRVLVNGQWVDVDYTLQLTDDVEVVAVASPHRVSLSAGGNGTLLDYQVDGVSVRLSWPEELPEPVLKDNVATYTNVLPGVDLKVAITEAGPRTILVIKSAIAADNPHLSQILYDVDVENGEIAYTPNGDMVVNNDAGETVVHFGDMMMWDSSGAVLDEDAEILADLSSDAIQTRTLGPAPGDELTEIDAEYEDGQISLGISNAVLTDPANSFPLYIDPSLDRPRQHWAMIRQQSPNTAYWNWGDASQGVGHQSGYGNGTITQRLLWSFKLPDKIRVNEDFPSVSSETAVIHRARFQARVVSGFSCEPRNLSLYAVKQFDDNNLFERPKWNGFSGESKWGDPIDSITGAWGYPGCSVGGKDLEWDAKDAVVWARDRYHNRQPGETHRVYLGLRSTQEGSAHSWRAVQKTAKLTINYTRRPGKPGSLKMVPSVDTNCHRDVRQRTFGNESELRAQARFKDADASHEKLRGHFHVEKLVNGSFVPVAGSPIITAPFTVPANSGSRYRDVSRDIRYLVDDENGGLVDGEYRWRARGEDDSLDVYNQDGGNSPGGGYTGKWSEYCTFRIDTDLPLRPQITVSPTAAWDFPAGGNLVTFEPPAGSATDIVEYRYSLNSDAMPSSGGITVDPQGSQSVPVQIDPPSKGLHTLRVWALDEAGNPSEPALYEFETAPSGDLVVYSIDEGDEELETLPGQTFDTDGQNPLNIQTAWWKFRGFYYGWNGTDYDEINDPALLFLGGGEYTATANTVVDTSGSVSISAWLDPDPRADPDVDPDPAAELGVEGMQTAVSLIPTGPATTASFRLGTAERCKVGSVEDSHCLFFSVRDTQTGEWNTAYTFAPQDTEEGFSHVVGTFEAQTGEVRVVAPDGWNRSSGHTSPEPFLGFHQAGSHRLVLGASLNQGQPVGSWIGRIDQVVLADWSVSPPESDQIYKMAECRSAEPGGGCETGAMKWDPPVIQPQGSTPVLPDAQSEVTEQDTPSEVEEPDLPVEEEAEGFTVSDEWSQVPGVPLEIRAEDLDEEDVSVDIDFEPIEPDEDGENPPGAIVEVALAGGSAEPTEGFFDVRFDADGLEEAFGGDWTQRLSAEILEEGQEIGEGEPSPIPSFLDEWLSDGVRIEAASFSGSSFAPASAIRVGVAAGPDGPSGDYSATPMKASASWSGGSNTGEFSWSYPIEVPGGRSGFAPSLSIDYSSAMVDGKTASTNSQASVVGEGFDLTAAGFIERSYTTCRDNRQGESNNAPAKSRDLCWVGDNQGGVLTMSIGGRSTRLVKQDSNTWVGEMDDGTVVKRHIDPGLNNRTHPKEYFTATIRDGTRYFFGSENASEYASVSTVQVYGNDPGEPCRESSFANSSCRQGWRFHLDQVVDARGNRMRYFWAQENNRYGANDNSTGAEYDRSARLARIEYGMRGEESAAPYRVNLIYNGRCNLPDPGDPGPGQFAEECPGLTKDTAHRFPDVPFDQVCYSDDSCKRRTSPTFFSTRRLIKLEVDGLQDDGNGYSTIDAWKLLQAFPTNGDGTTRSLWLKSIQRTGHVGAGSASLPKVLFFGAQSPSRIERPGQGPGGDGAPSFNKWRLTAIRNEAGGMIDIDYKPLACSPSNLPDKENLHQNTKPCMPAFYQRPGAPDPSIHFFHKYLVQSVSEDAKTPGVAPVATSYQYNGGAAWRYDEDPAKRPMYRTWSGWRGYAHVTTRRGSGESRTRTDSYYFRGMHGNKKQTGGAQDVDAPDVDGLAIDDSWPDNDEKQFKGFMWRSSMGPDKVSGSEGPVDANPAHADSHEINRPFAEDTADDDELQAWMVLSDAKETKAKISGTTDYRTSRVQTVFNAKGLPVRTWDRGDISIPSDDRCTSIQYAADGDRNMVGFPKTQLVWAPVVQDFCMSEIGSAEQVVSGVRYSYDDLAHGSAPEVGNVTRTHTPLSFGGEEVHWRVQTDKEYDSFGRETRSVSFKEDGDDLGSAPDELADLTEYTDVHGITSEIETTNSLGHESTQQVHRFAGAPSLQVDPAGAETRFAYDNHKRLTHVWLDTDNPNTVNDASYRFSYNVSASDSSSTMIKTETKNHQGNYLVSYEFLDGLYRPHSDQEYAKGDSGGRLLTEYRYDTHGRLVTEIGPYFNSSAPSSQRVRAASLNESPYSKQITYDYLSRPVNELVRSHGVPKWNAATSYRVAPAVQDGPMLDGVTVVPPDGGTATTRWSDVRGRVVAIDQYHDRNLSADPPPDFDRTTYGYTPAGQISRITGPDGANWYREYDIRGNLTSEHDPDRGYSSYGYDMRDQRYLSSDARGYTLHSTFDDIGREVAVREDDENGDEIITREYDTVQIGQLSSSTRHISDDEYTTEVLEYDSLGNPTETRVMLPESEGLLHRQDGYVTETEYYEDGSVHKIKPPTVPGLPPADLILHEYNAAGVPTRLDATDPIVSNTIVSPYGEVLQRTLGSDVGHDIYEHREYDPVTRNLTRQRVSLAGSATAPRLDNHITYDAAGNITQIEDRYLGDESDDLTWRQCFRYDYLRRLTEAWTGSTSACEDPTNESLARSPELAGSAYWDTYGYSVSGNRTSHTRVRGMGEGQSDRTISSDFFEVNDPDPELGDGGPHAISSADSDEGPDLGFTYDEAGNLKTRTSSDSTSLAYHWDAEGNLASVQDQSTAQLSFVYDADGNRLIERNTATGETTLHLGSTELSWSASAPGSGFTSRRFYSIGDETVAVMEQDETTFRFADHQGTPVLSIAGDDHGIEKRRFDPFGGLLEGPETDDPWLIDPTFDERGFLGKRTDALSRTYHLDAREYDPQLGRFISVDPILDPMDPQQMNGYAYASNSPITFMDPTGLFDWSRYWKGQQTLQKNANSGRTTSPSGVANPSAPQAVVVATDPNGNTVAVLVNRFDPVFVNFAEKAGARGYHCTEGNVFGGCGGMLLYGGTAFAEMYFLSKFRLAAGGAKWAWGGTQKIGVGAGWAWGQAKSGVGWAGGKAKGGLSWIGSKIGLGGGTVKLGSAGGATAGKRFPEQVRKEAMPAGSKCRYCGLKAVEVDHIIPRKKGGNATIDNAQPTCRHCNRSKGTGDAPKNPPPEYRGPWPRDP